MAARRGRRGGGSRVVKRSSGMLGNAEYATAMLQVRRIGVGLAGADK